MGVPVASGMTPVCMSGGASPRRAALNVSISCFCVAASMSDLPKMYDVRMVCFSTTVTTGAPALSTICFRVSGASRNELAGDVTVLLRSDRELLCNGAGLVGVESRTATPGSGAAARSAVVTSASKDSSAYESCCGGSVAGAISGAGSSDVGSTDAVAVMVARDVRGFGAAGGWGCRVGAGSGTGSSGAALATDCASSRSRTNESTWQRMQAAPFSTANSLSPVVLPEMYEPGFSLYSQHVLTRATRRPST